MCEANICIANISQHQRRRRLVNGLIALFAGIMLLALLFRLGSARWWRLMLFACFWVAASGFFQWQTQTCVRLAADGTRQLSDEIEPIHDAGELAQVRYQAHQVRMKSAVVAGTLTLLALVIPE